MNNYKKLYIAGFTALTIVIGIITWLAFLVFDNSPHFSNENKVKPTLDTEIIIDTVYKEKIVERVIRDTVYIKPKLKPSVTTDTTKKVPSTTSTQSPI